MSINETMKFNLNYDKAEEVKSIISRVYKALQVKGYDPVNQIVGYILSGDPTYITSHDGARGLITKLEQDELLEEIVRKYLETL
ncbi:MAG: IreB family regulatory phosphoprotein [Clostridia bacterium]|nr:IreB family regulatory phosphoprotein [Clostridia bacterium]